MKEELPASEEQTINTLNSFSNCPHPPPAHSPRWSMTYIKPSESAPALQGTVRLLFQPAEEGGAGAARMIKEGALGDAEAIFGMHNDYTIPTGTIPSAAGPALAAVSTFEARIEGKVCHAAAPHEVIDPNRSFPGKWIP